MVLEIKNKESIFDKIMGKFSFSVIQWNLLKTIERIGPISRRDLVNVLENPRTTIFDNLIKLQKLKLIEKFQHNNGERGRPIVLWGLKESELCNEIHRLEVL